MTNDQHAFRRLHSYFLTRIWIPRVALPFSQLSILPIVLDLCALLGVAIVKISF